MMMGCSIGTDAYATTQCPVCRSWRYTPLQQQQQQPWRAWLMDDSNSCSRSTVLGHAIEVSPLLAAG